MEIMEDVSSSEDWPTIPEFFKKKTIFITGGTGFMGKVLIEKLLWSCPELECIYILLRPKKGKESHQRLVELEKSKLFERLRLRDPIFFINKVKVINGDVSEIGLGLSPEDRQILIDSVSVVFHAAASVRFDDSLKEATFMNARGTREIMLLSHELKHISVVLHVSTAYCNTDKNPVYEKLYPPHADWKKTIEIAETVDEYVLQILTPKYISNLPNTYVFTKSLAEHVVNDLRGDIPTVIFRPSIVISSMEEPMPGWIENFNGPVGLLVASGKGILRSMWSNSKVRADYMAVDMAIRALITAAWKHGAKKKVEMEIPVYNCCSSSALDVSLHEIIEVGMKVIKNTPFNGCMWIPGGGFTRCETYHKFRIVMFQLFPAIVLDLIMRLFNQKPILFKIQRKIYIASEALKYYITNEFLFKNDKFLDLKTHLLESDKKSFMYNFEDVVVYDFLKEALLGARKFLMNEPDETLPQARIHQRRMYIIDKITKIIFWIIVIWLLYKSTFVRNIVNETIYSISGINLI